MSKNTFVIVLGFLIALTPYLGFSQDIETFIYVFSGLLVAFLVYLSSREKHKKDRRDEVFEENGNFPTTHAEMSGEYKQDSFLKQ